MKIEIYDSYTSINGASFELSHMELEVGVKAGTQTIGGTKTGGVT